MVCDKKFQIMIDAIVYCATLSDLNKNTFFAQNVPIINQ